MKFFTNKKKEVSLGNIEMLNKIIMENNRKIDAASAGLIEISNRLMDQNQKMINEFGNEVDKFVELIK